MSWKNLIGKTIAITALALTPYLSSAQESRYLQNTNSPLEQKIILYDKDGKEKETSVRGEVKYLVPKTPKPYWETGQNLQFEKKVEIKDKPTINETKNIPEVKNETNWKEIFECYYGFELGIGGGSLNVKSAPKEYTRVSDPHYGPTDLELKGASCDVWGLYIGGNLGVPIEPLRFLRFGYRATFPISLEVDEYSGNAQKDYIGVKGEDYYGAYSKVDIPNPIHSFYASIDVPIEIERRSGILLRLGVSKDYATSKIECGLSDYGDDEVQKSDKLSLSGVNPFFSIGISESDYDKSFKSFEISYRRYNMKAKTSYGDVETDGSMVTIGFLGEF